MSQIEIDDRGASLRDLVERAEAGEDVTLTRDGRTVARIVALAADDSGKPDKGRRQLGRLAGKWTVPDDFDAPLPDEVLALFYEGPIFPDDPPSSKN